MKKSLMVVSLLIAAINAFSQLSGTYTIGGLNPNYAIPSYAIADLQAQGINGSVIFNIRPGTYPGFTVNSTFNFSYPDSVIFQSETHDSTDVILTAESETVRLYLTSSITLKWLTLIATGTSPNYAVKFMGSPHCNVLNCLINTPNSLGWTNAEAAIDVNHAASVSGSSLTVANCRFIGKGSGINVVGQTGSTIIINNRLISTGRYPLYTQNTVNLNVKHNTLNGEIYCWNTNGPSFSNNSVAGVVNISRFTHVENNVFDQNNVEIEAPFLRGNRFNGWFSMIYQPSVIDKNIFAHTVNIGFGGGTLFSNNVVMEWTNITQSEGSIIANNKFYGYLWLAASSSSKVYCNLFYAYLELANSFNSQVYYNNFSDTAYLLSQVVPVDTKYNNFSQDAYLPVGSTITHNNYFPSGGAYDAYPFRFDPQYISSSNMRARNPLLIGKGNPFASMSYDIDSVLRSTQPTIGANELCIFSFSQMDSTIVTCGDEIQFKICGLDSSSGCHWTPSLGLNDTVSVNPLAKPTETTKYYLLDSFNNKIDSAVIIVSDFTQQHILDGYINCSQMVLLSGSFNPNAMYSWQPGTGLSDSTIYNPWAHPAATTSYIQQTTVPGCGIFLDTVLVNVDPLPVVQAQYSCFGLDCNFFNQTICADSFLWVFGDGQTSNLPGDTTQLTHHYDSAGTYTVLLIGCNSFGCDTFNMVINIVGTGIGNLNYNLFSLYPNPATNQLNITIDENLVGSTLNIYNPTGALVQATQLQTINNKQETGNLPSGVYIAEIKTKEASVKKRWVKM